MRRLLPILVVLAIVAVVVVLLLVSQTPPTPTPVPTGDGTPVDTVDNTGPTPFVDPSLLIPTATPYEFVEVVIAVQEIPRGTIIQLNAVDTIPWPAAFQPVASYGTVDDVIGKAARTDIYREQPILQRMIVDPLEDGAFAGLASIGSDAAVVIPKGKVAVSLPMDRITSVAYAVQPGDYIDLIASFLFVDVDRSFQTIEPNIFQMIAFTCDSGGAPPCPSNETITFNFSQSVRGTFDTHRQKNPVLVCPHSAPFRML
jgi:Flp pilus assembly protein CpaB